jgi:hypothetical protein
MNRGLILDAPISVKMSGRWERVTLVSDVHDSSAVACAGSDTLRERLVAHPSFPDLVLLAGGDMKVGSWGALCLHGRHCLRLGVHWDPPVLVASSHNGGSSFAL